MLHDTHQVQCRNELAELHNWRDRDELLSVPAHDIVHTNHTVRQNPTVKLIGGSLVGCDPGDTDAATWHVTFRVCRQREQKCGRTDAAWTKVTNHPYLFEFFVRELGRAQHRNQLREDTPGHWCASIQSCVSDMDMDAIFPLFLIAGLHLNNTA